MASKKNAAGNVYAELSKVGGDVTPNAGEEKTAFLERLTEAVSKLSDEEFDKLSPEAQKWFNAAGEAINAGSPEKIPSLPGVPLIAEPAATEQTEEKAPPESKPETKKGKAMASKKTSTAPVAKKSAAPAKKTVASTGKKAAPGRVANNSTYTVKTPDAAKRGFLKEYVAIAASLKKFTRDELISKVKSKKVDEKRALHYFYWCTSHGIFA